MARRALIRREFTRRGFTMIELMVTVAIILILITIVLVAVGHIGRSGKENATKLDLQNARSMLAELEMAGPLTTTLAPVNPSPGPPLAAPADVSEEVYALTTNATDPTTDPRADRWLSLAVLQTQTVMGRLRSVSVNRSALQALPGERLMRKQTDGKDYATPPPVTTIRTTPLTSPHGNPDPPLLVDSWNNPIIFVPTSGLNVAGTFVASRTYKKGAVVTNGAKFYRALKTNNSVVTDTSGWEELTNFNPVVTAPGGRPFFASAGPDGDFQAPDDNMYSFEP